MEASENVRWALLEHSSSIKPQQTMMTAHEPTRLAACLCTRDQAVIQRPSGVKWASKVLFLVDIDKLAKLLDHADHMHVLGLLRPLHPCEWSM